MLQLNNHLTPKTTMINNKYFKKKIEDYNFFSWDL